jgi:anthranilate synthase component 1
MNMEYTRFKSLAKEYTLIPVYEMMTADMLTPVTAYLKIRQKGKYNFLLESVEGLENLSRYSFIGKDPAYVFSNKGELITVRNQTEESQENKSIFDFIRQELKIYRQPTIDDLPDFTGGVVGYFGYENTSLIENVLKKEMKKTDQPDSIFGFYDTILAFDHFKHQIILITNVKIDSDANLKQEYEDAKHKLFILKSELQKPFSHSSDFKLIKKLQEDFDPTEFYKQVESAKEHIYEGEIFQIVISKKFSAKFSGDLLNVYRALRIINPSPYMYFLEFDNDFSVIGTSPEDLLKVKNGVGQVLPIAGTRRRGKTNEEDLALEKDLMNDEKELAEHTMLVDLGRNDLGRVCKYGTVKVTENMKVHRYSHVMHIVSKVEGRLSNDHDSIDALKSCFPAGTVTGAPKIRAMQLINKYEMSARNVYAGAVGYFDFSGNLDMCIAIRTLFAKENTIYWQAGAGIVADSKPNLEAKEIKNKSAALVTALKFAEVLDENFSN